MTRMCPALVFSALALAAFLPAGGAEAPQPGVRQQLEVKLDPPAHRLEVRTTVELIEADVAADPVFILHGGLAPAAETPGVRLERLPDTPDPERFRLPEAYPFPEDVDLEVYRIVVDGDERPAAITLRYAGSIHHPLQAEGEEYARAFRETPGTIEEQGVYLAGSTFWYPWFGPELVSFTLEVATPPGWEALSEGRRTVHEPGEASTRVVWDSPEPMEDIHLIAAEFTLYEDRAGQVATYAYLRTPDEGLAKKYLETTARYITMYSELLGPYPFAKFALVENFWETGYGMPSFTLLGPRIIRFPFILHSSYPHEILHNWWGNGVYVQYDEGNWCEGLTAYMADHLIKEGRGEGAAYRRDTLQKYADYVRDGRDFALTEFRYRHSGATEAVGYGKTGMLFHMLRRRLGEERYVEGLRTLYADNLFRRATFDDVRLAFEKATGEELEGFFDTWVVRSGAPTLAVEKAVAVPDESGAGAFRLSLHIRQTQVADPYPLDLPLAVTLEGRDESFTTTIPMSDSAPAESALGAQGDTVSATVFESSGRGRELDVLLRLPARPLRVQVDPDFDLFRRLDRSEIPPALGGAFGAKQVLLVLPSEKAGGMAEAWQGLVEAWGSSQPGEVEVVTDDAIETLSAERAVWLVGWDNRFRGLVEEGLEPYDAELTASSLRVGATTLDRAERSVVVAVGHPRNPDLALAFLATDNPAAVPGLARKLPHYGKYGYLGFEGDEPANVYKGQWPPVGSPLDRAVSGPDGATVDVTAAKRPQREALTSLPPAFSEQAIRDDVAFLADDTMRGRGCGSDELARAADFIEERFRRIGLAPGASDGSYRQSWTGACGDDGTPATMVNLVGVLPGRHAGWDDQSVVVVAHYDHLGLGWPDAHEGDAGTIHNGADDNASGVAVLLELARVLADSLKPQRSVVFVAVSGEEMGLLGSRHYVASGGPRPAAKAIGALNLDTVGRLGEGKVFVLGAGSAREWVHIVRGAGYVTGVKSEAVMDDLGGSDQKPFLEAGVPAVQFFTGPHLDYHRPTDDTGKIDGPGMVKVASFVREFVEYLAEREEPLASTLGGAAEAPAGPPAGGRRVSLGSVPDFGFEGPGYRLSGVTPDSPAEKAGLREGDVIVRIGEAPIEGLRDLSAVLKGMAPGDTTTVTYTRDGSEATVEVTLSAR